MMKRQLPHLFHGPLANEPLTACLKASLAAPILNKVEGRWSMDDAWVISLTCRNSLARGFRGIKAAMQTVLIG